eukprot:6817202-Lingulodinium_polyedra.AAC.1
MVSRRVGELYQPHGGWPKVGFGRARRPADGGVGVGCVSAVPGQHWSGAFEHEFVCHRRRWPGGVG